ncbi:MAG TPA: sigma-70 family RNA polymerase sigma factor [bacterium]|nr:sigma-70 family RNA polymerase sigma factor [bacterium]
MEKLADDSILIEQALAGEESAYADLVRRYQGVVARVVQRITRRPDWVPDLVQEVFIAAFRDLPRFRRESSLLTWLYRIAVNAALEALRREDARQRMHLRAALDAELFPSSLIAHDQMSGERMALSRELQMEVRDALERLPAEARAILTLRYFEEFSTPEIAEILELPEGTVRSRLFYARQELMKIMEPFMGLRTRARARERE